MKGYREWREIAKQRSCNNKNPNNPYAYASPEAFTHFNTEPELKTIICKTGLIFCSQ